MMKIAVLLALVAYVIADEAYEPKQAPGPNEAATRHTLGKQQHAVNVKALHYGAGVGTAPYYGVPGTDVKGRGHAYYGHNDGYYGAGYGAGYYGNHGYGYAGPYYGGHYYGGHGAHYGAAPYGYYGY